MSVPKPLRTENKLQAIQDILEFTAYMTQMCENEKIFPKKSRWTICQRIIDECIKAHIAASQANRIIVKTIEQADYRLSLQYDVIMSIDALWSLLTIADKTYNLPKDKLEHACNLLLDAEETTVAWRNSNRKQYADLK